MISVIPMSKSPPRSKARQPPRVAKVAISLPAALLDEVERRRQRSGESRSRFVARALARLLRDADGASLVREYVEGYRRTPEDPSEVSAAEAAISDLLDEEPWR